MQPTKVWQGVIILAYKTSPLELLLIENRNTGNILPLSAELEEKWNESGEEAAIRALRDLTGWKITEEMLEPTNVYHRTKFGPFRDDKAGDYISNRLFLLKVEELPEPVPAVDSIVPLWMDTKNALELITFPDLKKTLEKGIKEITG